MTNNRCVCCGAIIPEGLQVCPQCLAAADEHRYSGLIEED